MSKQKRIVEQGDNHQQISLAKGRSMEIKSFEESSELTISASPEQSIQIQIRFDAEGPVVSVSAQSLRLQATRDISVQCQKFAVEAQESIELRCEHDLKIESRHGDLQMQGQEIGVQAKQGSLRLRANDDVQAKGEMILLNCDRPQPQPQWIGEQGQVKPSLATSLNPATTHGDDELIAFLNETSQSE